MARKRLYSRIAPGVRALDGKGHLEALLSVLDDSFDGAAAKIRNLATLHDIDNIEDKYLPLIGPAYGHRWRSDKSYDWNRSRIRDAFHHHSYKGTTDCIEDLLLAHGAGAWTITDMASRLDIWNRQGGWNRLDGVTMGADLYHSGSFLLETDDLIDFEAFLADFQYIKPKGTVWWFKRNLATSNIINQSIWTDSFEVFTDSTPLRGFGRWNRDDFWYPSATPILSDFGFDSEDIGIDGGLLFAGSVLSINTNGLLVSAGSPANPLDVPVSLFTSIDDFVQEI